MGEAVLQLTVLYQDVTEALDKVGHAAYNLMPTSVKEALSQRRASQTSEPGTSPIGNQSLHLHTDSLQP